MVDRLDELQRLHDAATKGEWFQDEEEPHWLIASHHLFPKPDGIFLAQFGGDSMDTPRPNDAKYVAAMRNALPALLRVARAAAKLCDNNQSSNWVLSDHGELFAALAELRGTDG